MDNTQFNKHQRNVWAFHRWSRHHSHSKISVFASFSSFLSQPRAALLQSPFARSGGSLQQQVDSLSLSPLGAGVSLHSGKGWRKDHCLSQQMGKCFRKGHNNRTKLLTCTSQNRPHSYFISLALQKLQETAWFSSWVSAVLGAALTQGFLGRAPSFLPGR